MLGQCWVSVENLGQYSFMSSEHCTCYQLNIRGCMQTIGSVEHYVLHANYSIS